MKCHISKNTRIGFCVLANLLVFAFLNTSSAQDENRLFDQIVITNNTANSVNCAVYDMNGQLVPGSVVVVIAANETCGIDFNDGSGQNITAPENTLVRVEIDDDVNYLYYYCNGALLNPAPNPFFCPFDGDGAGADTRIIYNSSLNVEV